MQSSKKEDLIDWKHRELINPKEEQRGSLSRVFKRKWLFKEGSPEKVEESSFLPKKFLYAPHYFSKKKRFSYYKSLQVSPNENSSFFIGKFPAKIGSRPNTFRFPELSTQKYFLSRGATVGNGILKSPSEFLQVGGSWDTNFHTIQKQMDTKMDSGTFNKDSYLKWRFSLSKSLQKLKVSELIPPTVHNIDHIGIDLHTYAGVRWDKFFKMAKKGDALPYARIMAKELFLKTSRSDTFSESLWTVGGREKREDEVIRNTIRFCLYSST